MKNLIEIVTVKLELKGDMGSRESISSTDDAAKVIKEFLGETDREHAILACLNVKNQINNISIVSIGSLNSTVIHPREIFKVAILSNSASIILAHNHPSGDTTPSSADKAMTERLKKAGDILGIELIDNIILGYGDTYLSFRKEGLL